MGFAIAGGIVAGAIIQHDAASRAASAASEGASANLQAERERRAAATAAAAPNLQEMQQLQNTITLNEADIDRKKQLLESADPALKEAGRQALALLQGKDAAALDPIRRQREEQRNKLKDQLRRQLGPGFETSSAGIEALNKFDLATGDLLANAQQQSLGQLLGVTQFTEGAGSLQNNIGNTLATSNAYANQSNRMVSAINSSPIDSAGAAASIGGLIQAQGQSQLGANIAQGAGTLAGYFGNQGAGGSGGSTAGASSGGGTGYGLGLDYNSYFANAYGGTP